MLRFCQKGYSAHAFRVLAWPPLTGAVPLLFDHAEKRIAPALQFLRRSTLKEPVETEDRKFTDVLLNPLVNIIVELCNGINDRGDSDPLLRCKPCPL